MRTIGALILTLTLSTSVFTADWGFQVQQTWRSIAYLQVETEDGTVGNCTAFSIDEKKSIYMTVAHCVGTVMLLDSKVPAVVLYINDADDIMVLQAVTPYKKPALHPAGNVYPGQEIASLGYGMGYNQPMARAGIISIVKLETTSFGNKLYNLYDFSFVSGMSGAPVFDLAGQVVGIVNASYRDGTMGAGRPVSVLKAAWPGWK